MESHSFTSAEILAIIAALGVFVGTVGTVIIKIVISIKTKVASTESEIKAQTKQLGDIEILVDGRYSDVLQELADVRKLLAARSGSKVHQEKANEAQDKADKQEERVDKVKIKGVKEELDKLKAGLEEEKND